MSGIVGVLNLHGAPVDRESLRRMTDSMAFRGPDRQAVWSQGNIGFGHAALSTTFEADFETQPQGLGERLWITADARIDGRDELRKGLAAQGRCGLATDAELILNAYDVWEEECLQHILGDFAFAIWDERRRRLFCARDHFGVKPFYYARFGDCFLFSNTLECLRPCAAVSGRLNDQAIGDFLLFGYNQDVATTFFADIQRLPPAHMLEVSASGLRLRRYFALSAEGAIRFKRAADYVDGFKQLVGNATKDRLRSRRVAILMSGGLDSTTVAATAHGVVSAQSTPCELRAHTVVYDRIVRSEERHYASLMAQALGIPIEFLVADDYALFERWDSAALRTPEPIDHPLSAILHDHLEQVAAHHRVALSGEGGDPILQPAYFYCVNLLKRLHIGRFAIDVGHYLFTHRGELPPLGIRGEFRRRFNSKRRDAEPLPQWLNREFVLRTNLRERWEESSREPKALHAVRPEAYRNLSSPYWSYYFEGFDPGVTGFSLEVRSPLFDVRVVEFALALPPLPWCVNKELLRESMRDMLPDAVRQRPKSPLPADPVTILLRRADSAWVNHFTPEKILADYVDRDKIPPISDCAGTVSVDGYYRKLLPLAMNHWLKYSAPAGKSWNSGAKAV